jgi:hypothetical protein
LNYGGALTTRRLPRSWRSARKLDHLSEGKELIRVGAFGKLNPIEVWWSGRWTAMNWCSASRFH